MLDIRRAAARFETVTPGITTRHSFSSGSHYDPDNTAFGPLIALDEHTLGPGAGFGWHVHRGVEILSWVLAGTLRHEDTEGRAELVRPGTALHQSAGAGIEHTERNASATESLRFVQVVLLGRAAAPGCLLAAPPLALPGSHFDVLRPMAPVGIAAAEYVHLFVSRGTVSVTGHVLEAGDSVRIRDVATTAEGDGEVLVWRSTLLSGDR